MKQLNKNQYYVNGWIFDFRRMMALRGVYILDIKIDGNSLYRRPMFNQYGWILSFFDEPEHNYNKVIIDAYNSFFGRNNPFGGNMSEGITCPECDSDEIEAMEIDQDENLGYFMCTKCEHEFEADLSEEDY